MSALAFELPAAPRGARAAGGARPRARRRAAARRAPRTTARSSTRASAICREFLEPGDLLVVNTSATLPAALPRRAPAARACELRLSTPAPDRDATAGGSSSCARGDGRFARRAESATRSSCRAARGAELLAPYAGGAGCGSRGSTCRAPLEAYLGRHGHPIRYGYVPREWPLATYQTVFAAEPGSAEMPSAGRPFTPELVTALVARGVLVAPLTLHTGVSSPERHEAPYPERYRVPEATARLSTPFAAGAAA